MGNNIQLATDEYLINLGLFSVVECVPKSDSPTGTGHTRAKPPKSNGPAELLVVFTAS